MKLIIEIPEKTIAHIRSDYGHGYKIIHEEDRDKIVDAIYHATTLPKGHGRLGDLDSLREEVSSWGMNDYEPSDFTDAIDQADTIIKADKGE